jgi:hypothetical protein
MITTINEFNKGMFNLNKHIEKLISTLNTEELKELNDITYLSCIDSYKTFLDECDEYENDPIELLNSIISKLNEKGFRIPTNLQNQEQYDIITKINDLTYTPD